MEAEDLLVVLAGVLHLVPVLVADAVVDVGEADLGEESGQGIGDFGFCAVAWEEDARVVVLLDQSVCCVAVGPDGG